MEVINETTISMAELKAELEKIRKRDKELNIRANKTADYLDQFVRLSKDKAQELAKKLENLKIPRLKPKHINKLIDIMPLSVEEAKNTLSAYPITITNENLKRIVSVIQKFKEEK